MADEELLTTIDRLVAEEHEMRSTGSTDPERLAQLEQTLDQCWDLLRQRRAHREQGEADTSDVRPVKTVEGYQQ